MWDEAIIHAGGSKTESPVCHMGICCSKKVLVKMYLFLKSNLHLKITFHQAVKPLRLAFVVILDQANHYKTRYSNYYF